MGVLLYRKKGRMTMTIRKNTVYALFFYLAALMSRSFFTLFDLSSEEVLNLVAVSYLVGAILLLKVYRATEKEDRQLKVGKDWVRIGGYAMVGLVIALLLQVMLVTLEHVLYSSGSVSQNTKAIVLLVKTSPWFLFAVTVAGPIMEELVFRFSLLHLFQEKLSWLMSALLSSVLFALLHQDGHYLLYTGLGFFFCWLYRQTKSIVTPMLVHIGMNGIVMMPQLFLI